MGGKKIPSGALFYMPLSGTNYLQELGENRTMSYSGTLSPTIFNGIPCVSFAQNTNIFNTSERGSLPTGNHSLSLSIWVYQSVLGFDQTFIFYGKQATKANLWIFDNSQKIIMGSWAGDLVTNIVGESKWHHYVATYDKDQGKYYAYRDGILISSSNITGVNLTWKGIGIGRRDNTTESRFRGGYMAGARMYDRALSQEEITLLANEYTPLYEITASDQTFRFTPVDDPSTKDIIYSSAGKVSSFEIISGELPNTITLNTSSGKFSGKALTDADHTYNLVVRMSGSNVATKDINVTINTVKTTNLSITSPQTFNFTTESSSIIYLNSTCESYDYGNYEVTEGSLPTGISLGKYDSLESHKTLFYIVSSGNQTSSSSSSFQIAITTQFHPTPVYATINVNIALNQITVPDKSFKFYVDSGSASEEVEYTTQNPITPVYSLSGTLPNGFTFNTSTGIFTYDGVYDTPTSGEVNVIVNSSTGYSTQGIGKYTIELKSGSPPLPSDYSFYAPLQDVNETQAETGQQILDKTNMTGLLTAQTFKGVPCIYSSASSYVKRWWRYDQTGIASGPYSRSFSVWVYFVNSAYVIFAYGQTGDSPIYGGWIRLTKDSLDFAHYGYSFTNFTAQLNTWYHFAVNIDRNLSGYPVIQLYINGELKETGTTSSNNFNTSSTGGLYVFGNNWQDGWFSGYISSLRIYNRVLSQAEITRLYQEFTPTT